MKKIVKLASSVFALILLVWVLAQPGDVSPTSSAQRGPAGFGSGLPASAQNQPEFIVGDPVFPVRTVAVRDLPPLQIEFRLDREINPRFTFDPDLDPTFRSKGGIDPLLAVQAAAPAASDRDFDTPIFNYDGAGYTFLDPPDTVGDVGANHYIQMINATIVTIYDKNTAAEITSFDLTTLGGCATGGGDPIVLYDQMADRWLLSEFGAGSSLCVFISQTADPTGSYYSYNFATPNFPDYPKYGVWPDAYYVTTNESGGPAQYAFDRMQMLAGQPATSQRFVASQLAGFGFEALTPSDLDGITPPPAGSPNYIMRHRDDEVHNVGSNDPNNDFLEIWEYHVDWTTPGNSTFAKVADVPIAEIDSDLCGLVSFSCVPQPGSGTQLDPLREVIMFRLGYRNFGSHETLVGNLVTDVSGSDHHGVRWFELRKSGGGSWGLYQEGTYAPDAVNRWMGAIAMDGSGNMALGYNVSDGSSTYPGLRYAGRLVNDPLGTMPQGEYVIVNGSAANGSNRYGDYSAMSIDPIDDCTFWFTGEYNVSSQWSTRIAAFKFDACGGPFSLSAVPPSQDICAPADAAYTVTVESLIGYNQSVSLSASGIPAGTSAVFDPAAVTPTATSLFTVTNTGSASTGSYNINIIGVSPTSTLTTTVGLNLATAAPGSISLTSPANGASNVPTQPTFTWQPDPTAVSYAIDIATDPAFTNIVDSATGLTDVTYTPGTNLNTSTTYYWRVRAGNGCGDGAYSATFIFTTEAAPGDCSPGSLPNDVYFEDFESGAGGWTTGGSGSTWALSGANPYSGSQAFHADNVSSVSDQHLESPAVTLPAGEAPLTLQFWNYQELEDAGAGCYDGGVLEISTDGGSSWTRLESELLTDPYDGPIDGGFGNPLAGQNAWCGDPQPYLNSIVDLDAYAGQAVNFRFRLATDTSVSHPGWDVDDVKVQSCQPSGAGVALPGAAAATGAPGTAVVYTIPLTNTGIATDTFDLSLTGGWDSALSATAVTAASGEVVTVTATVTVPVAALAGESDVALLIASAQSAPAVNDTMQLTTAAAAVYGVLLSPDATASGDPGTTVTHTLYVTNTGNITDSFTLSVAAAWPTMMPVTNVTLPPGGSMMMPVTVAIPTGAMGQDVATVTAVSVADPAATAVTRFTTRLDQYYIFLPVITYGN